MKITANIDRQVNVRPHHGVAHRRLRYKWSIRFLPILFFQIYLNVTVLLFAYGPWPWPVKNATRLLQGTMTALSLYLCQGYYALSLALEKPFVSTWGVGNSFATIRQAERIPGNGVVARRTYPYRIESEGWDAYGNWSSIYPWIASDVSFPGTILVVLAIGYFFILSWRDTLRGFNPFAVAVFSKFTIMLYYFPANNQVLQTPESLIAFCGTCATWMLNRNRRLWLLS
jgi:hypothetical protein